MVVSHLQRRGIQDILVVEVTPSMIEAVRENFPSSKATAGNELQVRTWLGDVQSIPAYQVRSAPLPTLSCLPQSSGPTIA